jgi:vacuolar-type H+-ATPase subunit F/Vma7
MRCVLLADRVTSIAYHLAGVETVLVNRDQLVQAFEKACTEFGLVMITGHLADRLPGDILQEAIQRAHPPVQVITPVYSRQLPPNVANIARRSMGVSK